MFVAVEGEVAGIIAVADTLKENSKKSVEALHRMGNAEMRIDMDEASLPDSSILVQANHSGRTATRKFRLRKLEG